MADVYRRARIGPGAVGGRCGVAVWRCCFGHRATASHPAPAAHRLNVQHRL